MSASVCVPFSPANKFAATQSKANLRRLAISYQTVLARRISSRLHKAKPTFAGWLPDRAGGLRSLLLRFQPPFILRK